MSDFYFFTDHDLLNVQGSDDDFGPITGVETSQFNVTSLHTASEDPRAIAICAGTLFAQYDSADSSLINIALKPMQELPFNLESVAYIIYKGIKKSSLVSSLDSSKLREGYGDMNHLVDQIHDDQESLNSMEEERTGVKLNLFFQMLIPTDLKSFVKELIIPKVHASVKLIGSIEVPRTLLRPVNPTTLEVEEENPENSGKPRAQFSFGGTTLYFDTQDGIGFEMNLALSTVTPVMLPGVDVVLDIQNLKLDLSEKRKIPEEDKDLTDPSCKGMYLGDITMNFPPEWKIHSSSAPLKISGTNMLFGNPGGLIGAFEIAGVNSGNLLRVAYSQKSKKQ